MPIPLPAPTFAPRIIRPVEGRLTFRRHAATRLLAAALALPGGAAPGAPGYALVMGES